MQFPALVIAFAAATLSIAVSQPLQAQTAEVHTSLPAPVCKPGGAPRSAIISSAPVAGRQPTAPGGANVALSVNCGDTSLLAATAASGPASTAPQPAATPSRPPHWLIERAAWGVAGVLLLAVLLTLVAVSQARGGEGMRYTSYWGGFGGSGTGWHVTPAAVSLLAAALLATIALTVLALLFQAAMRQDNAKADTKTASHSTTATGV